MKWYKSNLEEETFIFIVNKKYTMFICEARTSTTGKTGKHARMLRTIKLKNEWYFKYTNEITEIESLFIDFYPFIKPFIEEINKIPLYENCKNHYNEELLEFKQYFKELERNEK